MQNLLGGGEVAMALAREVIEQVLEYEQLGRQLELLDGQIVAQLQRAVMEVSYRLGEGSTSAMLTLWQQTEDLEARRVEMAIDQGRVVAELKQVDEISQL